MNKNVIIGAVVAVGIIVGGVIFYATYGGKSSSTGSSNTSSGKYNVVKACSLFTLDEAKQLIGESASIGDTSEPPSSDDISVDNCSYTNNATTMPTIRVATVMVRSALSNDGLTSNKEAFEPGGAAHPSGATAVEGYGEKAFWTPGQLAILKGNIWIGIVYGGANPANNTLEDAKKLADLVAK